MSGNYEKLVEEHQRQDPPEMGKVNSYEINHDDWCDFMHLRGPCNCEPEVVSGPLIDRKYGEPDAEAP